MKKIVSAPYIDQTERWVNGCESISSVMLLQAMGIAIDPDTFIERDLPHAPYWDYDGKLYGPDPYEVYPGDPHDHTGYGCYSPPASSRHCRARWITRGRRTPLK